MAFDKVKYDNQYAKINYDRLVINVKKGEREIIKEYAQKKGYKYLNDFVVDLIHKEMNGGKNITVGDIKQSGKNNSINIG